MILSLSDIIPIYLCPHHCYNINCYSPTSKHLVSNHTFLTIKSFVITKILTLKYLWLEYILLCPSLRHSCNNDSTLHQKSIYTISKMICTLVCRQLPMGGNMQLTIQRFRGNVKKKSAYLNTLSKLRVTTHPPTLFLTNYFLTSFN